MRYIVIYPKEAPFTSERINEENLQGYCIVIDTHTNTWTKDGEEWLTMEEDSL